MVLSDHDKRLAIFWMVKNAQELVEKVKKGENSDELVYYINAQIENLKQESGDAEKINYMLSLKK